MPFAGAAERGQGPMSTRGSVTTLHVGDRLLQASMRRRHLAEPPAWQGAEGVSGTSAMRS
ncbi:hypothetical protein N9188_00575 [bacterium]|nr:hypothetical protein [bacterium]